MAMTWAEVCRSFRRFGSDSLVGRSSSSSVAVSAGAGATAEKRRLWTSERDDAD